MPASQCIIGVDEAGRGPVIGPLVLSVVYWDAVEWPGDLALADSKKLTRGQRRRSHDFIRDTCKHSIVMIPPWCIDRSPRSLPVLEAELLLECLRSFPNADVLCDRLSAGERIHRRISDGCPNRNFEFETKADDRYEPVSAASIVAKVTRDRAMDRLADQWGTVGSGYPSDSDTRDWLREWYEVNRSWPPIVRRSWNTIGDVEREVNQEEMFPSGAK